MTTTPASAPTPAPAGASAWVNIDLDAIRDNVAELARRAGSAQVMAVVKGDAYGHGLVPSARAALAGGATWLGVAQLAEALDLRRAGVTAPLLTWLFPPGADVGGAIDADIEVTVGSGWTLDAVVAAARERGRPARVQVKVDTGLGRGGILTDWSEMVARVATAQAEGAIEVTGVWSHFAWADAPQHPTVRAQQVRFVEAADELERAGRAPGPAPPGELRGDPDQPVGALRHGAPRPGRLRAVAGARPRRPRPLRPARGDAGHRPAHPGQAGPGRPGRQLRPRVRHRPRHRARPGADGVRRRHPEVGRRAWARCWSVGTACRSPAGSAWTSSWSTSGRASTGAAGDEVVVLGRTADGEPSAQDWAEAAGTINYEIITRMGPRLPRVLLGGQG